MTKTTKMLAGLMMAGALVQTGPVVALDDTQQVLIGGNSGSGASTRYSAPGYGNTYPADFPGVGMGNSAAQIRMPAGTLSNLKVRVLVQPSGEGGATSGDVQVRLLKNGNYTTLGCTVAFGSTACTSTQSITLVENDRISVRVISTLDTGAWTYSYSMTFD